MAESKFREELDLRKLEVFYWVAELRSFSLAADHLSLKQPTVSSHVGELEQKLGAKLLNRVGREITPTPLGRLLRDRARELLSFKRETLGLLDSFQGNIRGELVIGGSSIPGEYILPGKLRAFTHKYPQVKPILRIGDSENMVNAVLEGAVELGFVGFKGAGGELVFQKLWKDEMILAVPRGHPWVRREVINLTELRNQPFISRESGSGTLQSFCKLVRRKAFDPEALLTVAAELGSTEAVKGAVIAGWGISILSRTCVEREIEDELIAAVRIQGLKLERDFFVAFHRHRILSPVSQAFVRFLKQS